MFVVEGTLTALWGSLVYLIRNNYIQINNEEGEKKLKKFADNWFKRYILLLWLIAVFIDPILAKLLPFIPIIDNYKWSVVGNTLIMLMFYVGYYVEKFLVEKVFRIRA